MIVLQLMRIKYKEIRVFKTDLQDKMIRLQYIFMTFITSDTVIILFLKIFT